MQSEYVSTGAKNRLWRTNKSSTENQPKYRTLFGHCNASVTHIEQSIFQRCMHAILHLGVRKMSTFGNMEPLPQWLEERRQSVKLSESRLTFSSQSHVGSVRAHLHIFVDSAAGFFVSHDVTCVMHLVSCQTNQVPGIRGAELAVFPVFLVK